jgi:hypothetical protein
MTDELESDDALNHPVTGLRALMLRTLEQRLKLPQAYIMSLHEEPSDWVFIVKLALLVEATLTEYIVLELGKPALYEHMSNTENSKRLQLAVTLGLLEKQDRGMLMMLAEVRNAFAHQVVNLNRTLADYIRELPLERKKEIVGHLMGPHGKKQLKEANIDTADWLPDQFRGAILDLAVLPLITMSLSHSRRERDQERAKWESATPSPKARFESRFPDASNDLSI